MFILLVNPIVSADFLAKSLANAGLKTIALFTIDSGLLDDYRRPAPNLFDIQLFMPGAGIDEIIENLRQYKIDYVIHGTEKTLHLSEELAYYYTPSMANNPKTSNLRCNKFEAYQQLKRNGFPVINQLLFDLSEINIDEIVHKLDLPYFFRPLWGNSSKYVQKITTNQELSELLQKLSSENLNHDLLRASNEPVKFILSEYIEGREFSIDSFSYGGKHHISSIIEIHKKIIDQVPFYRCSKIVNDNDITNLLIGYINDCLDVLGFNSGFAHSEVFIKNNKVYLIEVNPRISGGKGIINHMAQLSGSPTQVDLFLKCHYKIDYKPIKQNESIALVDIYNFSYNPLPKLELLKKPFPVITEIHYIKQEGYRHTKLPTCLSDEVALVICSSKDEEILNDNISKLIRIDENGLLSTYCN